MDALSSNFKDRNNIETAIAAVLNIGGLKKKTHKTIKRQSNPDMRIEELGILISLDGLRSDSSDPDEIGYVR